MKEEIRQKRQMEKLAAYLGKSVEELPNLEQLKVDNDEKTRQVQAIHLFLEKPNGFVSRRCDTCGEFFLTTYVHVSVCSDSCRRKSLERIGISWNPTHTPEERWKRAGIPIEYTIPPSALHILMELAREQTSNPADCETPEETTKHQVVDDVLSPEPTHQPIDDVHRRLDELLQELDLQ